MYNSLITTWNLQKYGLLNTQKYKMIQNIAWICILGERSNVFIILDWKLIQFKIHVVVKDGYIFYANEYLGTGYLLNGTKIRQLQVNKIKRRGNNSKLTIKIDIWEFKRYSFIRWMGKKTIYFTFCKLIIRVEEISLDCITINVL